jgi:hypothetical protein
MGNVLINEKYPDGIFHRASEFKRAHVKDKLVWFSDYNIVTREKKALYLRNKLSLCNVYGVGSIFALCDFTDHFELRVFDLSLNQITSYNISDAGGFMNAVLVKMVSAGNRVLFVGSNTVGGKERRCGFFDYGSVLFPMYKHPYKDIVAIPAKNGDTFTVYLKDGNTFADIGNFSPQIIPVGFMEFGFEFIPKN